MRLAVVDELGKICRVIASAATIMFPRLRQLRSQRQPDRQGVRDRVAVAIAIDVGLVRFILVPAVMALVGERMWWLPSWLDRILPPFSVEGEGYFAERDADAARESAWKPPPILPRMRRACVGRAGVAQLVEHFIRNGGTPSGSSLVLTSKVLNLQGEKGGQALFAPGYRTF